MILNKNLLDICVINTNLFIAITKTDLFVIYINNRKLEIKIIILGKYIIVDFLYIKKYNLFILSHPDKVQIFNINRFNIGSIQIINTNISSFLLYLNKNSFILYNDTLSKISIYKKRLKENYYELISNYKLDNHFYYCDGTYIITYHINNLFKLDDKTIIIFKENKNYLINIPKMKIKQTYCFFDNYTKIDFIYKNEDNIYTYKDNTLYILQYFKNEINLINIINLDNSKIFIFLSNLLQKSIRNLNIKIKWIQNKNYKKFIKFRPLILYDIEGFSYGKSTFLNILFNNELENSFDNEIINTNQNKKNGEIRKLIDERKYIFSDPYIKNYFKYNRNKKTKNEWKKDRIIYLSKKYKKNYR